MTGQGRAAAINLHAMWLAHSSTKDMHEAFERLLVATANDARQLAELHSAAAEHAAFMSRLGAYMALHGRPAAPVVALHSVKEPGPETRPSSPPAAPDAQPSGPGNPAEGA